MTPGAAGAGGGSGVSLRLHSIPALRFNHNSAFGSVLCLSGSVERRVPQSLGTEDRRATAAVCRVGAGLADPLTPRRAIWDNCPPLSISGSGGSSPHTPGEPLRLWTPCIAQWTSGTHRPVPHMAANSPSGFHRCQPHHRAESWGDSSLLLWKQRLAPEVSAHGRVRKPGSHRGVMFARPCRWLAAEAVAGPGPGGRHPACPHLPCRWSLCSQLRSWQGQILLNLLPRPARFISMKSMFFTALARRFLTQTQLGVCIIPLACSAFVCN